MTDDQRDLFGDIPSPVTPRPARRKAAAQRQTDRLVSTELMLEWRDRLEKVVSCGVQIDVPGLLVLFSEQNAWAIRGVITGWGLWAKHPDGSYDETRASFMWDCPTKCFRRRCY